MNNAYRLAIFDVDGTLADSFPFFISVFNQLAAKHHFKPITQEEVPGLRHLTTSQVLTHLGLPRWKIPFVAKDFMALMRQPEVRIPVFDGVADVLIHLKAKGLTLAVVSSNAEDNVRRILGPQLTALFTHVDCGVSMFGKSSRLRQALRRCAIPASQAVYVGDQLTDQEAARKAGVPFGAVAWGYTAIESLRKRAPRHEFDTVQALKALA